LILVMGTARAQTYSGHEKRERRSQQSSAGGANCAASGGTWMR
jgi:hypothetical protein